MLRRHAVLRGLPRLPLPRTHETSGARSAQSIAQVDHTTSQEITTADVIQPNNGSITSVQIPPDLDHGLLHEAYETTLGLNKCRLSSKSSYWLLGKRNSPLSSDRANTIRDAVIELSRLRDRPYTKDELYWGIRAGLAMAMVKHVKIIMRMHMTSFKQPAEILVFSAQLLQNPELLSLFLHSAETFKELIYQVRPHATDHEVLRVLWVLIARLKYSSVRTPNDLIKLACRFAARTRNLDMMYKTLRSYKDIVHPDQQTRRSAGFFRSLIAKFSIGHRGLAERRNGKWSIDDLRQVLLGFDREAHLPPEERCHIGAFLVRESWLFWHGWLAALGLCEATDQLIIEWELWRDHYSKEPPDGLPRSNKLVSGSKGINLWFIQQLAQSGSRERAWEVLNASNMDFADVSPRVKIMLLSDIQHAGSHLTRTAEVCMEWYDIDIFAREGAESDGTLQSVSGSELVVSKDQLSRVVQKLLQQLVGTGRIENFLHDLPTAPRTPSSHDD